MPSPLPPQARQVRRKPQRPPKEARAAAAAQEGGGQIGVGDGVFETGRAAGNAIKVGPEAEKFGPRKVHGVANMVDHPFQ